MVTISGQMVQIRKMPAMIKQVFNERLGINKKMLIS
jgi:hypothetical protein